MGGAMFWRVSGTPLLRFGLVVAALLVAKPALRRGKLAGGENASHQRDASELVTLGAEKNLPSSGCRGLPVPIGYVYNYTNCGGAARCCYQRASQWAREGVIFSNSVVGVKKLR